MGKLIIRGPHFFNCLSFYLFLHFEQIELLLNYVCDYKLQVLVFKPMINTANHPSVNNDQYCNPPLPSYNYD